MTQTYSNPRSGYTDSRLEREAFVVIDTVILSTFTPKISICPRAVLLINADAFSTINEACQPRGVVAPHSSPLWGYDNVLFASTPSDGFAFVQNGTVQKVADLQGVQVHGKALLRIRNPGAGYTKSVPQLLRFECTGLDTIEETCKRRQDYADDAFREFCEDAEGVGNSETGAQA